MILLEVIIFTGVATHEHLFFFLGKVNVNLQPQYNAKPDIFYGPADMYHAEHSPGFLFSDPDLVTEDTVDRF